MNITWFNYGKTWDQFTSDKLNKAGTIIELDDGETLLIGTINRCSGTCNCCAYLAYSTSLIVKYGVIDFNFQLEKINE